MNILITSISRKVPLIEAVRAACHKLNEPYTIYGADANDYIIGKYFVDEFWHMPRLVDLTPETIIDFCNKKNIRAIIPTRDGELSFFAENKQLFSNAGIEVMVSHEDAIKNCLDKFRFFQKGESHHLPLIKTSVKIEDIISDTFVVKERFGAGGESIGINLKRDAAMSHARKLDKPIFQPYILGAEYSVDIYLGRNHKAKGAVVRKRELVINGESQMTTTCHMPKLEQACIQLAESFQLTGHVIIQALVDNNENIHIIECNPRFGGASSLSLAAGLDSFYWFLLETMGEDLEQYKLKRSKTDKKQVRYPKDLIIDL